MMTDLRRVVRVHAAISAADLDVYDLAKRMRVSAKQIRRDLTLLRQIGSEIQETARHKEPTLYRARRDSRFAARLYEWLSRPD